MPRLPPAEKLPLALRKNIRDNWENKKAEFETKISEKLGTAWTIDVNPLAIFPYASNDYAKESLGSLLAEYVDSAIYHIGNFVERNGADSVAELNEVASKHVLTVDLDEAGTNSYCGCAVQDGQLVIMFNEKNLGVNVSDALQSDKLLKALNDAPRDAATAPKLSFAARTSIAKDYEPKIEAVRVRIAKTLARDDLKLEPNFEANYAVLSAAGVDAYKYEENLGSFTLEYFEGVAYHLDSQKFGGDDMLQEGFNEAVEKGVIALRVVDSLKYASYCEVVVEDGTLFVQTTAEKYGVNINDAAEKIIDQL
ncbi:hypothetical protein F503_03835 [Ophiostoma piceae UAMH 11346]|uniref:Uncharacterized protein n=1 Tax=Ophiostoma piceae (strain UAMH 11346) TaxID=1262450 RepID=S3CWR2_OPHP1|nr:hypothetical protein F503_03835 [Ophiostoma piceae UAMH 11346]